MEKQYRENETANNRLTRISWPANLGFNAVLLFFALACFLPFVVVFLVSITDEASILSRGYQLLPKEFSLQAYRFLWKEREQIIQALIMSLAVTGIGTVLGVLLTSVLGYVMSRPGYRLKGFLTWMVFIPMIFNGGMVASYVINVQLLQFRNGIHALILPLMVGSFSKGGAYHMLDLYDGAGVGVPVMGVRYDDQERKVVSVFESEEIMANLNLLHKWYNDGLINADAATLAEAGSELPFYVAQGWAGAWTYTKDGKSVTGTTVPFIGPISSSGTIMGSMNGVYAGARNPEKVLEFLQLVNTDSKLRDMICYGEEGVNFEYVDGLVEQNNEKPWPWARYTQGNHAILTPTTANPDLFSGIAWVNDNAVPSVLMGFNLDRSKIEDELAQIKATYEKYQSEMLTGTADPAEIVPAMMDELKAVGFDEVMAEVQRQIDAHFAK